MVGSPVGAPTVAEDAACEPFIEAVCDSVVDEDPVLPGCKSPVEDPVSPV